MRKPRLLAIAVLAAIVAVPSAQAGDGPGKWHGKDHGKTQGAPAGTVIASGLANPRGINFDKSGDLWIAEAGSGGTVNGKTDTAGCFASPEDPTSKSCFGATGAYTRVHNGHQERVVSGLPSVGDEGTGDNALGASDILPDGKRIVGLIGAGGSPDARASLAAVNPAASLFGHIVKVNPWKGTVWPFADFVQYEADNNPDMGDPAEGGIDSDAYGLATRHGKYLVADAGGNDLLGVKHKSIRTLAVFADVQVPAPPFLNLPAGTMIPMQAVPTSIALRPKDPNIYVGQLTGFPFVPGAASVWVVKPDGTKAPYLTGFTNIVDIAWAPNGSLYVLEISKNGLTSDDPGPGALIRIWPDGTRKVVASDGLMSPTAVAFGKDGTVYVANKGTSATDGEVISLGKV